MLFQTLVGAACTLFAASALAVPTLVHKQEKHDGIMYNVFKDEATNASIRYVSSKLCETTQGVAQYSGYLSVGSNMNMFFWFFAARNNPSTAPLATWFNGGPGCSSMIGLFQENGPCKFTGSATTPSLNQYSFNTYANMLYVDQPIGVGFSYGTDAVSSSTQAATYVWTFLQAFYNAFPQYESRDFGIFTESYGGHYGPAFADYFQSQNTKISQGSVSGQKVSLVALGINNGYYDSVIQQKAYITYGQNNSYRQILTASNASYYTNQYNTKCLPALKQCTTTDPSQQDSQCSNAENTCYNSVEIPILNTGDYDVYDVREPSNDPYPPTNYIDYLNQASVQSAIGAKSTNFQMCSNSAGQKFDNVGDISRSFLPTLNRVVQTGIQVLIWAGDADMICNYIGNYNVVQNISYSQSSAFQSAPLTSYTVSGKAGGLFKTKGNLSWLQVYGAGHEVPYYQPALALQVFRQTMSKQAIAST